MELQKLVLVHLKLSSKALWFEPPTIVKWEAEKGYWSTEGFFDVKFDEGKQTLSFRTINFGIFALSAFRFSNLPLQSWELRYATIKNVFSHFYHIYRFGIIQNFKQVNYTQPPL